MGKVLVLFMGFCLTITTLSCKKRGCTLEYAINYDATAKKDNKSCEFYYKANIKGIRIMDFPDLDHNGEMWDVGSLPDIAVRMTDEFDGVKFVSSIMSEVQPDDTLYWALPSFVKIDTLAPVSQFKIYEVDNTSLELIEKFPVNFLNYMHESELSNLEKYPDSVAYYGDKVAMKIYLNWIE